MQAAHRNHLPWNLHPLVLLLSLHPYKICPQCHAPVRGKMHKSLKAILPCSGWVGKASQASWYMLKRLAWRSVYWEAYGDIIASIARIIKPLLPSPQKIKNPPLLKSMVPAMESFKVSCHRLGPDSVVHIFQFCCVTAFAKSSFFLCFIPHSAGYSFCLPCL